MSISGVPVCAQEPVSADDVLRIRTDLVTVNAIVRDAKGRRVTGLTRGDFSVSDNGRAVQLEYFAAGGDRVALTFALDASGSVRDIITRQRETALALFSRFGRGSRAAVLHFRERPEIITPLTAEPDEVRKAFDFPALRNRRTAIFDAALAAVRLYTSGDTDRTERRIVILISDGLDTVSSVNAATVIGEAQKHNVSFYVIHFPLFAPSDGHLAPRPPAKGFRELAEKTGGRYFMLGDVRSALDPRAEYDLGPIYRAIEEDLQSQYVLGYYPGEAARDGRYHQIEVKVISRDARKYRVQLLREGYQSGGH
jgi:Ca-activated chloride channel family protein